MANSPRSKPVRAASTRSSGVITQAFGSASIEAPGICQKAVPVAPGSTHCTCTPASASSAASEREKASMKALVPP